MSEATIYLVKAICDLLTIAIILNFFFRLFKVDYYNPLVRGIVSIVDPPIRLVRVFLKPFYNLDLSSILVSVIIQFLSFYLIALTGAITSSPVSLILWSFYSILLLPALSKLGTLRCCIPVRFPSSAFSISESIIATEGKGCTFVIFIMLIRINIIFEWYMSISIVFI